MIKYNESMSLSEVLHYAELEMLDISNTALIRILMPRIHELEDRLEEARAENRRLMRYSEEDSDDDED